jgi:hypothetical protein
MNPMPLAPVVAVEYNDGVIRAERLACGHLVKLLSTQSYARRRRCCHCAPTPS